MQWLSFLFPRILARSSSSKNRKINVVESEGQRILQVNDIQQTGPYVSSLFSRGLKVLSGWHKGKIRRIAVLGVGGGGILFRLQSLYPHADVIAVDYDAEIIRLGKAYFGFTTLLRTSFVVTDARKFINLHKYRGAFDIIIVDLYIGNDVPEFVESTRFHLGIKRILAPRGTVMMNYFSFNDQPKKSKILLDKLSKIYQSVISKPNRRNIFFFCR